MSAVDTKSEEQDGLGEYGEAAAQPQEPEFQEPEFSEAEESVAEAAPAKSKKKKMRVVILGVGVLLLAITGFVVVGALSGGNNPPPRAEIAPIEQQAAPVDFQDPAPASAPIDGAQPAPIDQASVPATADPQAQPQQPMQAVEPAMGGDIAAEIADLKRRVAALEKMSEKRQAKSTQPFYRVVKDKKRTEVDPRKNPIPAKEVPAGDPVVSVGVVETPAVTVGAEEVKVEKVEQATPVQSKPAVRAEVVKSSTDAFVLRGVMSGMAWLAYKEDGKVYVVRNGDKLPNGAKVTRIDAVRHYVDTSLGGIQ